MIGDTSCLLIGITICNGRGHFGARANFVREGGRPAAHGWRIQAARGQLRRMEGDWLGLSAVDEEFASDLSKCYHSFVQLDGAIDDEEDAARLVAEIIGNKRPALEVERVTERFGNGFQENERWVLQRLSSLLL